jgi:hypothetical protein
LIKEVVMSLRTLCHFAATIVLTLMGAAAMHGQAGVEYGTMTSGSAGVAASVKPPIPNAGLPGSAPSAVPSASSSPTYIPAGTAEAAAKTSRQLFQDHSGPGAAQVSLHTVPNQAQAWIDGKFVGATPLDLKLAPGHHRVLVRAPNMQESMREFDLAAKQTQSIDLPLKSAYQDQVNIHWSPQQK